MGQKSNVTTLRKSTNYLNLYRTNNTEFLYGFFFLRLLEMAFKRRNIFLTDFTLNFVENKIFFNLSFFFKVAKILQFKNLGVIKKKIVIKKLQLSTKSKLSNIVGLFLNTLNLFKKNLSVFFFTNMNSHLRKKRFLIFDLFNFLKRDGLNLFPRRFRFFLDFVKMSVLFCEGLISLKFFVKILAEIFRILQKKKHARFLAFVSTFFSALIDGKLFKKYKVEHRIKGVKFILNGKIKGKPRSSSHSIVLGETPIQSLDQNIEFVKSHAFTIYGVFGLKIWVCYKV
jgi:hypothetical protein